MRWLRWQSAPIAAAARAGLRVWRPELLESRLALSHASLADDGTGPMLVTALQNAAVPDAPRSGASTIGTAGYGTAALLTDAHTNDGYNSPAYTGDARANSTHDDNARYQPGFSALVGLPPAPINQPLPQFTLNPNDAQTRAVNAAISTADNAGLELIAVGRSADNSSFELIFVTRGADPSAIGVHSSTDGSLPTANPGVSPALTFGISAADPAGVTHNGPAVVSSFPTGVENSTVAGPNHNVPLAMPADVIHRVVGSEPPSGTSPLPLLERPNLNHEHAPAPGRNSEPAQPPSDAVVSGDAPVDASASPASREMLIAGIAVNFEVIDRALAVTLDEIEQMGGDLAAWLDETDAFTLASVGVAVLLTGGGSYYWRRRRVGQLAGKDLEEPSSWLFTHLYIPPVQP